MNRNARWVWLVASVAVTGAALVLAFVLSLTSQSEGFYERHFIWLFWLNVAVGGLLLLLVIAVAAGAAGAAPAARQVRHPAAAPSWPASSRWSGCCPGW